MASSWMIDWAFGMTRLFSRRKSPVSVGCPRYPENCKRARSLWDSTCLGMPHSRYYGKRHQAFTCSGQTKQQNGSKKVRKRESSITPKRDLYQFPPYHPFFHNPPKLTCHPQINNPLCRWLATRPAQSLASDDRSSLPRSECPSSLSPLRSSLEVKRPKQSGNFGNSKWNETSFKILILWTLVDHLASQESLFWEADAVDYACFRASGKTSNEESVRSFDESRKMAQEPKFPQQKYPVLKPSLSQICKTLRFCHNTEVPRRFSVQEIVAEQAAKNLPQLLGLEIGNTQT